MVSIGLQWTLGAVFVRIGQKLEPLIVKERNTRKRRLTLKIALDTKSKPITDALSWCLAEERMGDLGNGKPHSLPTTTDQWSHRASPIKYSCLLL
jgi:hypothetical protein